MGHPSPAAGNDPDLTGLDALRQNGHAFAAGNPPRRANWSGHGQFSGPEEAGCKNDETDSDR